MRIALTLLLAAVVLAPLTADAIDVSGRQWGTWTRDNSPYNVVGDIRVPVESTLVIEPGVVVNFQGHYKFIVNSSALLLARGTENDSIYFTSDSIATGWHGIRLMQADSNSQLSYCHLQYGKATGSGEDQRGGAIYCSYCNATITHNTISQNSSELGGGAIYCAYSDATISFNTISRNKSTSGRGGALNCFYSSPRITNNIFVENQARSTGGGIRVQDSTSPIIRDNIFRKNRSYTSGGAIFCSYASPEIVNNTITENVAKTEHGGGINCFGATGATISGNTITANWAAEDGGGLFVYHYAIATIQSNIIKNNYAGLHGGGIYCSHSEATITNNTISGNSAGSWGGAIHCCLTPSPIIDHNSVSGNSADCGGALCCRLSANPTVSNSILWGDSATNGPEVYVESGNPQITYCDVQGGWQGQGNIDADPIFVGPYNDDFHLRWHSPCIDAGDPDFPLEPDGTRSDIGAFYFNQDVDGIVELYPHETLVVIPPEGGNIVYDGWVFNFFGYPGRADIWTYAFLPGMGQYGPIDLYQNVRIPADSIGMNEITQHVPAAAPEGDYVFVAYVGEYPSTIIDSSCFYFTKTGSIGGGVAHWFEGSQSLKESDLAEPNLPAHYALSQNYPNPFNATTVIAYTLPVESHVELQIYNVRGQKVATLVDEKQAAGQKSVDWNASELSSGVYFYKLTAGDFSETRRMMLVK